MSFSKLNKGLAILVTCSALALSGCTHAPKNATTEKADVNDPFEPVNRGIYKFNYYLDQGVLRPVTVGYRYITPVKGQKMVHNFLENLYSPAVFVNSVLQGDPQNSFATVWRFILNTTFGGLGFFDFASEVGLYNRPADLGQTLGFYGVGTGPFLELPIIGPSNVRDGVGRIGDAFLNPVNYADANWVWIAAWGVTAIDQRSQNMKLIDDVYSTSLDPYATFRSLYTQKRVTDVKRAHDARQKALENHVQR
jgi:phospholipid-binding lipoprotein MlaA